MVLKLNRYHSAIVLMAWVLLASHAWSAPYDVVLGRPTDRSIAISVLATNELEVYVECGTQSAVYTSCSATNLLAAGTPGTLTLDALQGNQRHYYRVRHRTPGGSAFSAATEYTFHTQRASNSTFSFAVEADPHHFDNVPAAWRLALANMLADSPDFLVDLGDTFMDEKFDITNYAGMAEVCRDVRTGIIAVASHSLPLLLVTGNHEAELGWFLDTGNPLTNMAVWATRARQKYYPCPVPGAFCSGSATADPYVSERRDSFYSFTWGNALFIMLDPYWYSMTKPKDGWAWTLGSNQYYWLKDTLEHSTAMFTFVFLHTLVGGSHDGVARGGLEYARYYEWGGCNSNGTWGFTAQRPGWPMPIEELLLSNGVDIVFHGHDHLFVRQEQDSNGDGCAELLYQEVPQPSRTNYNSVGAAAGFGYTNGVILGNSGHLRVSVSPSQAVVDYVRTYLPGDETSTKTNRMVSYSYTIPVASVATTAAFDGTIILGRPTDIAVTLNMLANSNFEVYVEHGTVSGVYPNRTATNSLVAGVPVDVAMSSLLPNTKHYYRIRFKTTAETEYRATTERTVHTQRTPGSTFCFDLYGDPHLYDKKGEPYTNLYRVAMNNIVADKPDFLLDLGDTFGDDHYPGTITYNEMVGLHLAYRPFFDIVGQVAPLFFCIGNHEGETIGYEYPTNTSMICTYATQTRLLYYPNPFPNAFYTGNTNEDIYVNTNRVAAVPENYYAWTWGDALFVVLDAYRYLPSAKPSKWDWTLGKPQYDWFKKTLEDSPATFKFVFIHHLLGQGRGGTALANLYEWGGYGQDGVWEFTAQRPGWAMPIHQLMVSNRVTMFFQGHDHLFAKEELDGVVYIEAPMPSDGTYVVGDTNADAYTDVTISNSGHLRVTVNPSAVQLDYIRAFLPADEQLPAVTNRTISYRLTVPVPEPTVACIAFLLLLAVHRRTS